MSWYIWSEELLRDPQQAVDDLLRGAASISPFDRATPHEFLLAVLPRSSRLVNRSLLGDSSAATIESDSTIDLPPLVDAGLSAWLLAHRHRPLPAARKLSAYAAQVCEALQWPLYFKLPQTRAALRADRARWLPWLSSLTLTAYRDPEYDYWQMLAARQSDNSLQFFWQSFVVEAGRTRSNRYLNLGLLALAQLPLSEEDSLRNLRLQVQALVNRYQRRMGWGVPAQQELAEALRHVMVRNVSMGRDNYRVFLMELLRSLGEDKATSVLTLLGLGQALRQSTPRSSTAYKLQPPAGKAEADQAVQAVHRSNNLAQAWNAVRPLLVAHEDYLHKSGDAYSFVRTLDICARALCVKYRLRDPEIQSPLFQWIQLALRIDADDPRLWMLWQLALRQADQPERAKWVLWEMTRRFPDHLPCRVELARLLAVSGAEDDLAQAQRLLQQVLELDPDHLHAHSTLAQLAIRRRNWDEALVHAAKGLRIDPANAHSIMLLTSAYVHRARQDDLQTAIDQLQRFVKLYPGNRKAEDYLSELVLRQQQLSRGQPRPLEDDETPAAINSPTYTETDPAWAAFAQSIETWVAASKMPQAAYTTSSFDRLVPLPQALQQAVAQQQWSADVLEDYDAAAQQEFPLEIRLWRYLQALQARVSAGEIERAKQSVMQWIEAEARVPQQDSPSWLPYLRQNWTAVQPSAGDGALATGTAWLQGLLDRYQPLPAPLLA